MGETVSKHWRKPHYKANSSFILSNLVHSIFADHFTDYEKPKSFFQLVKIDVFKISELVSR